MAGAGLLALLDDVTALLDDVASMTKVATSKTAGIVGDDIAVNARQVIGVRRERELAVVGKVFYGSLVNKAILVPAFFGLSLIANGALIPPVLMMGGAYLCYEGCEKILHGLTHKKEHEEDKHKFVAIAHEDPQKSEDEKVRKAITTDFILSAEIIAISLGAIAATASGPVALFLGLAAAGVITSVAVYGLVGGIVSLDDAGLWLASRKGEGTAMNGIRGLGRGLISVMPYVSKTLGVVGTAAMLLVGGGIFIHGFHGVETFIHAIANAAGPLAGGLIEGVIAPMAVGTLAGIVSLPVFEKILKPGAAAIYKTAAPFLKRSADASLPGKSGDAPTADSLHMIAVTPAPVSSDEKTTPHISGEMAVKKKPGETPRDANSTPSSAGLAKIPKP